MNETVHQEGAPWSIYKRFGTFQEADAARSELATENEEIQVKIKWMSKTSTYAVKTRLDPSTAAAEAKRDEKRRRKKKLSKKRRKK